MEYPVLFEPSKEGGFVVTFPDFDWGVTQGETEQDAREMALDALCTMIREHVRNGEHLPRPSKPRGRKYRMIRLPALAAAKTELYMAFDASGMRKAEMARRTVVCERHALDGGLATLPRRPYRANSNRATAEQSGLLPGHA
jgi:predicted RNase H-like HicB family nuclease